MDPEENLEFDQSSEEDEKEGILLDPELAEIYRQNSSECSFICRSIRIGAYKVHPYNNVPVNLSTEAISFCAPTLYDSNYVTVSLRCEDITRVLMHFGRCLPILFIFTTANFGENVSTALGMNTPEKCYFNPLSRNEKIQKITFLIESITEEQCNLLRHCFPGEQKVKEIDLKEANEILVKSTPCPGYFK